MVWGQAVDVTVVLGTNNLQVGQSTTLRVLARVRPEVRPDAERIFSWYVDVLNTNGTVAFARYNDLVKASSDNQPPPLSSSGVDSGFNRFGIYDTCLNFPGAGLVGPVELLSVPVTAVAQGQTRFVATPGTGVVGLVSDFLVAPLTGDEAFTGGDYSQASAVLTVSSGEPECSLALSISRLNGGGPGQGLQLSFTPCPGRQHVVEATTNLADGSPVWTPLPGAPHNSGLVTVTNNVGSKRYFRLRVADSFCAVSLSLAPLPGLERRYQLSFQPCPGRSHTVEAATSLSAGATLWTALPGAPHNSGQITVTNQAGPSRFFRVRVD
jgi:hypothetical protein